ncbi:hypothetical protein CSE45_2044 [Citreicella sp. SE45]|nr:hypothetical protein CSE45_2044 [Citreicella sp. SE45]
MTERVRIQHHDRRYHVMTRAAVDAAWISLGEVGDVRVAVRLWLAVLSGEARK